MTNSYLHAEFPTRETVVEAIESLAVAGVAKGSMELYSRQPLETDPPLLPRRSWMSVAAVASGIAFGTSATALVFWMQLDYPVVTGGMPITSGWATAVVTFETTMAGAVLGTIFMMIREAGLLMSRSHAPVPELPDEGVVLQVRCSGSPELGSVKTLLLEAGAVHVETAAGSE